MTNEHERLRREIERLERELETPVSPERRRNIQSAIAHLKDKQRKSQRPR